MTPLERYHNNRYKINEKQKAYFRDVYYRKNRQELLLKALNQNIKRKNDKYMFIFTPCLNLIPIEIKKNVTVYF